MSAPGLEVLFYIHICIKEFWLERFHQKKVVKMKCKPKQIKRGMENKAG